MIRPTRVLALIASLSLLYTVPVIAQPQQVGPWFFSVDGGGLHQSEADLKDGTGGFSKDRWFVSAGVTYAWSRRDSIGISAGGGKTIYEFNEEFSFGSGDPWDNVEDSRVSLSGRFGFGETGTVFIIPTLRYNKEKGASSGDSSTWGLFGAATWRVSEDLTIGPGIGIFSRLEDGTRVFPILAIDWNINERWNLSTGRGLASSVGPGLSLTYKINDDWSLGLTGRYEDVEFRLNDEGVAPGGIGRDQSIPLIFSAGLSPSKSIDLSVFAGLEFAGKLKLKDVDDVLIEEEKYDPALLVGATFEFRF